MFIGRRIIAVNAGLCKGRYTDTLIAEASRGAESIGAAVAKLHFTGTVSVKEAGCQMPE